MPACPFPGTFPEPCWKCCLLETSSGSPEAEAISLGGSLTVTITPLSVEARCKTRGGRDEVRLPPRALQRDLCLGQLIGGWPVRNEQGRDSCSRVRQCMESTQLGMVPDTPCHHGSWLLSLVCLPLLPLHPPDSVGSSQVRALSYPSAWTAVGAQSVFPECMEVWTLCGHHIMSAFLPFCEQKPEDVKHENVWLTATSFLKGHLL